jgi:hypothetical protein
VQVKADDSTDVRHIWRCSMKWRSLPPAAICQTWCAKLCKARAFALRNGTPEEQETALELLRTR